MPRPNRQGRDKKPRRNHFWTPQMVTRMKKLWSDGQADLDIARVLNRLYGTKLTRNAIQGKLQRTNALGKKTRLYRMRTEDRAFLNDPDIAQGMRVAMVHLGYALQEIADAQGVTE